MVGGFLLFAEREVARVGMWIVNQIIKCLALGAGMGIPGGSVAMRMPTALLPL